MSAEIAIAEAVEYLRAELVAAAAGSGTGPRFEVGPVELEFSVEMRKEGKGKAGLKAWVVSAGAEASVSKASVHRVKLVLTPKDTMTNGAYHVNTDQPDSTGEMLGSKFGE
ncbi:trypco2 family protein [Streptomyces griseus]|uniref:trypco2 family protein n=1 Tax=Streptomyces griseus TaxID=1911 RepID=UPI00056C65E1|nr:trypco2 family protein [Streptomyces griseus]